MVGFGWVWLDGWLTGWPIYLFIVFFSGRSFIRSSLRWVRLASIAGGMAFFFLLGIECMHAIRARVHEDRGLVVGITPVLYYTVLHYATVPLLYAILLLILSYVIVVIVVVAFFGRFLK